MKLTPIIILFFALSSCSEKTSFQDGQNPLEPKSLELGWVTSNPSVLNLDTISSFPLKVRLTGKVFSDERTNTILTFGILSKNGYSATTSDTFLITPMVPEFISNLSMTFDNSQLEKPEFFISVSKPDGRPVSTQTGIIKLEGYENSTSAIDSIRFSPADGVRIGERFSMRVYVSDQKGTANLDNVFVIGKRPNGTLQSPFDVPKTTIPGLYYIEIDVPQSAQTGTFTWTFYAQNKAGALSKPVIKFYQVRS
ncbi:MAG: hypothetical protein LCH54_12100 [Bacteroidetes bacterium]|nr:hypothetical protein [Bacteroidota bacterium]